MEVVWVMIVMLREIIRLTDVVCLCFLVLKVAFSDSLQKISKTSLTTIIFVTSISTVNVTIASSSLVNALSCAALEFVCSASDTIDFIGSVGTVRSAVAFS